MRIAVLCSYPFPDGLAATTRIRTYCKGLTELGNRTIVFVYNPTSGWNSTTELSDCGIADGVEYCYPNGRKFSKYKIFRILGMHFWNKIKTGWSIYKESRREKIDFLLIANDYLLLLYLFIPFCHILRIKPVFITDEYPEPIRSRLKERIPGWKKKAYDFILSHTTATIFMTEKLNRYYNPSGTLRSFILPTITDTSRFNNTKSGHAEVKYLCYMGNMELAKDNVDNILVAFSKISARYPDVYLYLYGAPSPSDKARIEPIIQDRQLTQKVFLKGRVDFDQVPDILHNAHILVSSQPNSKRAEGGFPTKLGEYLATGKPILLTDVGEISQYVTHGEHVYIVPPEDSDAYAAALAAILDNYDAALQVGQKGKVHLCRKFDYKVVSSKLLSFLQKLNDGN